jgi:hypothetical protein
MAKGPPPHDWTWLDALIGPVDDDFARAATEQPPAAEDPPSFEGLPGPNSETVEAMNAARRGEATVVAKPDALRASMNANDCHTGRPDGEQSNQRVGVASGKFTPPEDIDADNVLIEALFTDLTE